MQGMSVRIQVSPRHDGGKVASISGRFVVIEGADATGKTTLGARLGAQANTTCVESPPRPLRDIKTEVFKKFDPFARLLYFASGNAQLSSLASKVDIGQNLVGIRYIWSTLAYHSAMEGVGVATTLAILKSVIPYLIMPEYVIFLTAQRDEQLERLALRGELPRESFSEAALFNTRLAESFREAFDLLPVGTITMDTTFTSVDDLAASLLPRIRS